MHVWRFGELNLNVGVNLARRSGGGGAAVALDRSAARFAHALHHRDQQHQERDGGKRRPTTRPTTAARFGYGTGAAVAPTTAQRRQAPVATTLLIAEPEYESVVWASASAVAKVLSLTAVVTVAARSLGRGRRGRA